MGKRKRQRKRPGATSYTRSRHGDWRALQLVVLVSLFSSWGMASAADRGSNKQQHRKKKNIFLRNQDNVAHVTAAVTMDNAAYTQCTVSMVVTDVKPRNQQLSATEFVHFVGRLVENEKSGTGEKLFDPQQPLSAQPAVFSTLFQRGLQDSNADSINIQGARPGSTKDTDQLSFLRDFCQWTYDAIAQWKNPSETPSTMPSATPTRMPRSDTPTTAVPTELLSIRPTTARPSLVPTRRPSEQPSTKWTSTHVPRETPTPMPSHKATLSPSVEATLPTKRSWTTTIYNSFVVGNTQGANAWDLTLRGQVALLQQAYESFLQNVTTATTVTERQTTAAISEIIAPKIYRILNSPCPRSFHMSTQPGERPACQSMYGSFDLTLKEILDAENNNNTRQEFLEDLFTNQTQQAIIDGDFQVFVEHQLGVNSDPDGTTLRLTILGEATTLRPPDTLFPTPSPSSSQTPSLAPTQKRWRATIYNGFVVGLDITSANSINDISYTNEVVGNATLNDTNTNDTRWVRDLQSVYPLFVNRTVSQALGNFPVGRFRLRGRRLTIVGALLESAQIYQVNQGNCNANGLPWNDTSAWECHHVFASFDLFFTDEMRRAEITTLITNVTQQAIEDGQLQADVESTNLSTTLTIVGVTATNVPDSNGPSPTTAPTSNASNAPTSTNSEIHSPTFVPATAATNSPTPSANAETTHVPSLKVPEVPSHSPTVSKTSPSPGPTFSQSPQPDRNPVDSTPTQSSTDSSPNTVLIVTVGGAMMLLGLNIGFGLCLCIRRRKRRTGATDVEVQGVAAKQAPAPSPASTSAVVQESEDRITVSLADLMELVDAKSTELVQKLQMLVPTGESGRGPNVVNGDNRAKNSTNSDVGNVVAATEVESRNNGVGNSTDSTSDDDIWPDKATISDNSAESSMDLTEIGLVPPPSIHPAVAPDKVERADETESNPSNNQQIYQAEYLLNGAAQAAGGPPKEPETTTKTVDQELHERKKSTQGIDGSPIDERPIEPEETVDGATQELGDPTIETGEVIQAKHLAGVSKPNQIVEHIEAEKTMTEMIGGPTNEEEQPNEAGEIVDGVAQSLDGSTLETEETIQGIAQVDVSKPNQVIEPIEEEKAMAEKVSISMDEEQLPNEADKRLEDVGQVEGVSAIETEEMSPVEAQAEVSQLKQAVEAVETEKMMEADDSPTNKQLPNEAEEILGGEAVADGGQSYIKMTEEISKMAIISEIADGGQERSRVTENPTSLDDRNSPLDDTSVSHIDCSSLTLLAGGAAEEIDSENAQEAIKLTQEQQQPSETPELAPTSPYIEASGSSSSSSLSGVDGGTASVVGAEGEPPSDSLNQIEARDETGADSSFSRSAPSESNDSSGSMDNADVKESGVESSIRDEPVDAMGNRADESDSTSCDENEHALHSEQDSFDASEASDNGDSDEIGYRDQIIQLLEKVMPDEVENVDIIMEQFEGREGELIATLVSQQDISSSEYTSDDDDDATTSDSGLSSSFEVASSVPTSDDGSHRDQVLQLMEEVMPDEVNNIDVIMEQFQGREQELIVTLLDMANSGDEDDYDDGSEEDESTGEGIYEDDSDST